MSPTPEQVLACPMSETNDAGATTVGDYLIKLLLEVWEHGEGFSGKRPFGNSGWEYEVYEALAHAGLIEATFDDYGYLSPEGFDREATHSLVYQAIEHIDYLGVQIQPRASEDPENDVARDPDTGECRVCRAAPDEPHDQADHDNFHAAEDATWD